MKTAISCSVLILGLSLWMAPLAGQSNEGLVADKSVATVQPRQVDSLQELFQLVEAMKAEGTLKDHRRWVEGEYNRLIREMEERYHPGPAEPQPSATKVGKKPAADTPLPGEYGWAAHQRY